MAEQAPFSQTIIAVIWDFDRTLSPHYMQKPLFEAYGVDQREFWREVNALPAYYGRAGIHVQDDTCYLGHILSYVQHGVFAGLSNARLRELGAEIVFFPGMPEALDRLKNLMAAPEYQEWDIRVEHYVVSTGLAELIRGSAVAAQLDGIWASEFIEEPAPPRADLAQLPREGAISQIAGALDNTTKPRAVFEIHKGVNRVPGISVNDAIPESYRRVPFENMLYIADGPSDVPSFSVVKKHGGFTFAVHDPESKKQFAQVAELHEQGRIHAIGPADYREHSPTSMWLEHRIVKLAKRIIDERKNTLGRRVGRGPSHLGDG